MIPIPSASRRLVVCCLSLSVLGAVVVAGIVPVLRGDANGDDRISAADALAVLSHVVGRELPAGWVVAQNGDTDCDMSVTAADALVVLARAVGHDVSQHCVGERFAASVRVSPDSVVISSGDSVRLAATVQDARGDEISGRRVIWSRSDSARLHVDSTGLVIASSPGTAVVMATVPEVPPVIDSAVVVIGASWYQPTPSVTWQWQLQGTVNTAYDVALYDIDLVDSPSSLIQGLQATNRKVICYFSAGSFEPFRPDSAEFRPEEIGNVLDGFEDERWLDIRSENVLRIMGDRLDLAVAKGCDGVEPDNVDGYANDTGFPLTAQDQLVFNQALAALAHARGLAVGLKNDLDQIAELLPHFDFSVNEQCHEFDECDLLTPFVTAGKPVFNAEYADAFVNDSTERARICARSRELDFRTLILPLDLDDAFRLSCDSN